MIVGVPTRRCDAPNARQSARVHQTNGLYKARLHARMAHVAKDMLREGGMQDEGFRTERFRCDYSRVLTWASLPGTGERGASMWH
jgi:hypothetical protein